MMGSAVELDRVSYRYPGAGELVSMVVEEIWKIDEYVPEPEDAHE